MRRGGGEDGSPGHKCFKDTLKTAGAPIPLNDVWISAQALEAGGWLITFDRHFRRVPGLLLWR